MSKVRIEMHLTSQETELLDKIADQQGRCRKNLCETELRKMLQFFLTAEKEAEEKKKLFPSPVMAGTLLSTDIYDKVMD